MNGIFRHQLPSAGRHHDRIADNKAGAEPLQTFRNGAYDSGIVHHSYFDGSRLQIVHDRFCLHADNIRWNGVDGLNPYRILCGNGGNDGGGIPLQCGNRLNIRLYACAAGTIGTGNGENDWSGQHDDKMIDD